MRKLLLLLPFALAACEPTQQHNLITVACGVGPAQFPQYAQEILLACAELTAQSLITISAE